MDEKNENKGNENNLVICIRLPYTTIQRILQTANSEGTTRSAVIRRTLLNAFNKEDKNGK